MSDLDKPAALTRRCKAWKVILWGKVAQVILVQRPGIWPPHATYTLAVMTAFRPSDKTKHPET
jgi:hypothetical protein